jgi:transcriptional regulator with XRE-family HTH domain
MAPVLQRFGEKLRTLRKNRQMTLLQLAEALDYSTHSYLSELESNKKLPPVELVIKIARFFDVSTDQLLKDELEISPAREG